MNGRKTTRTRNRMAKLLREATRSRRYLMQVFPTVDEQWRYRTIPAQGGHDCQTSKPFTRHADAVRAADKMAKDFGCRLVEVNS